MLGCSTLPIVQLLHRSYLWRRIPIWCFGCWNLRLHSGVGFCVPMEGVQTARWVAYRQNVRLHRGSSAVITSTWLAAVTEILFTFRSSLMKITLPYLSWRCTATSVIPGIMGLSLFAPLCVSWRHRQWQCCPLHKSDSMEALTADIPSMFTEIAVSAQERLWLLVVDIFRCDGLMWRRNWNIIYYLYWPDLD